MLKAVIDCIIISKYLPPYLATDYCPRATGMPGLVADLRWPMKCEQKGCVSCPRYSESLMQGLPILLFLSSNKGPYLRREVPHTGAASSAGVSEW